MACGCSSAFDGEDQAKFEEGFDNAGGSNTSCWSVGMQEGQECQDACESAGGTYDGTYNNGGGGCVGHSPTFEGTDKKERLSRFVDDDDDGDSDEDVS